MLLTVTEAGQGRRTPVEDYRLQFRGGKGIRNYNTEEKGTRVAAVRLVEEGDDAIIISDDGVIIRIPVDQIATQSRYGGGVRVMRVAEGSRVVSVARAPGESEDEEAAPEGEEPVPEESRENPEE